jgi:hypothetical protein
MSDQPEVPASTPIPQLPPEKFRVWDQVVENCMFLYSLRSPLVALSITK